VTVIMAGAEPYWHGGGEVGCLILHGFAASPAEVRWLAQHLAGQGHTVYAPRLPGHGTAPQALARMRWPDWFAAVLDGYTLVRAQCRRVCVVGHSMGGLLALMLASDQPVDAVAALAAPIRFRGQIRFSRIVSPFIRMTDRSDRSGFPERLRQAQARRGEPATGRVRYDLWPTRSLAELVALSDVARSRLARITAPLLLVDSRADTTVPLASGDIITRSVASADVERHTLDHSDHIITQDVEHEQVFAYVAAFIERVAVRQATPNLSNP
jgi:carboxylesterase